jgi:hypothetical protein
MAEAFITVRNIVSSLPAVCFASYAMWRYFEGLKARPHIEKGDIAYQEWYASGSSQWNYLTMMGGGRNCIRLVVTRDLLWVTSWFPFSLISPLFDMEHVIPLRSITSLRNSRFLWKDTLLLTFSFPSGDRRTLRLMSKDPKRFVASLGIQTEEPNQSTDPAF